MHPSLPKTDLVALARALSLSLSTACLLAGAAHAQGTPVPEDLEVLVPYYGNGAQVADIVETQYGGVLVEDLGDPEIFVYEVTEQSFSQMLLDSQLDALTQGHMEENYPIRGCDVYTPDDPMFGGQWNLPMVSAPQAWTKELGDHGVVVAHLDTGIDYNHPDLAANVDPDIGYDYVATGTDPLDADSTSHGTATAGVICAEIDNGMGIAGIAQVTVMPIRVLVDKDNGNIDDLLQGLRHAIRNDVDIITMSLGGPDDSTNVRILVDAAWDAGIFVVASSGNEYSDAPWYPAAYDSVIGVGAVNSQMVRTSYSNWGVNVELMAPGHNVLTTLRDGYYGLRSGTSLAAPHVAGAAAIALSFKPNLTNTALRDKLFEVADDLEAPGYDTYTGYGLLDMWRED
jgi:subtilisin family serine protease